MKSDFKSRLWALVFLLFMYGIAPGQQQLISMEGITDADFDKLGNLYLSTSQGSIIKYDSSFRKTMTYAPEDIIPVTSIDATYNFRIFGFYKNDQSYRLIDRNLKLLNESRITEWAGNGIAAAYGSDHSIWLFDDLDLSLKKINPALNQVSIDIRLPLVIEAGTYSVIQLEEYQNRIFINNSGEGIYVFDLFGNFLKHLQINTSHFFKFHREKLYFIDLDAVKSIDIYTQKIEFFQKINDLEKIITVLCNDHQILLIYQEIVLRVR
jgi:hypothetical protein